MRRQGIVSEPTILAAATSPVTGEDHPMFIYQDGSNEAESLYAFGELIDLFSRVSARIARVGPKALGRQVF